MGRIEIIRESDDRLSDQLWRFWSSVVWVETYDQIKIVRVGAQP